MCIDGCFHLEITEDLMQEAELDERRMGDMTAGYGSTIPLSARRDFIGSLAQNGVNDWLERNAAGVETQLYFDSHRPGGDDGDFFLRGEAGDVKGSPIGDGYHNVFPNSRLFVRGDSRHNVAWYVFVKVDVSSEKMHVAGCIRAGEFWERAEKFEGKYPARYVLARQLVPFLSYVWKTY